MTVGCCRMDTGVVSRLLAYKQPETRRSLWVDSRRPHPPLRTQISCSESLCWMGSCTRRLPQAMSNREDIEMTDKSGSDGRYRSKSAPVFYLSGHAPCSGGDSFRLACIGRPLKHGAEMLEYSGSFTILSDFIAKLLRTALLRPTFICNADGQRKPCTWIMYCTTEHIGNKCMIGLLQWLGDLHGRPNCRLDCAGAHRQRYCLSVSDSVGYRHPLGCKS